MRYLESTTTGSQGMVGIALRYANFYGPGSGFALDGDMVELVHNRRFVGDGDGGGVWSSSLEDAAAATIAAIERGAAGIYNIVDDEPAAVATWLPELADIIGAKPRLHVPAWLERLAVGEVGVSMMTRIRGCRMPKPSANSGGNGATGPGATDSAGNWAAGNIVRIMYIPSSRRRRRRRGIFGTWFPAQTWLEALGLAPGIGAFHGA